MANVERKTPEVVVQHAPRFDRREAARMAVELFGVEGTATELPSERDQNFHIQDRRGEQFVLKIANATERVDVLDFQHRAIEHLTSRTRTLALPRLVVARDGHEVVTVTGDDGRDHLVRMLTYVPGVPLAKVKPHNERLLGSLGRRLGEMSHGFEGFTHPAMHRLLAWNLRDLKWMTAEIAQIETTERREIVGRFLSRFHTSLWTRLGELRQSVIHNDWNDYNVLVSPGREVIGAIDFGDIVHSYSVCDLAVAAAYAMLDKPDPIAAAAAVVSGYHDANPLAEADLDALFPFITARLCVSVVMAARQRKQAPDNEYLQVSEQHVWALLDKLANVPPEWARYAFRHACSLPPCPNSAPVVRWLRDNRQEIGRVIDADLSSAPMLVFDFSPGSTEIEDLRELDNVGTFAARLFGRMAGAGVEVGVGRYGEARLAYRDDRFIQPGNDGPEARTIHLGIDLFVAPGTPIYAPIDGIIHSVRDNAGPHDYGPTIILEHTVDSGRLVFWTLYGHLSRESLDGLTSGQAVSRGQSLGRIGDATVNGGWTPHLHVQLIADMLGRTGNFPGVAAPSQRDVWQSLSPDPNVILNIPEHLFPAEPLSAPAIVRLRGNYLGRNLRVSYRRPLTMVRGYMQHLYDENGRRYLDGVNNVAHVGHSHPRVVRAISAQLAVLNTNTRYLHENLVRYARRLAELLPDPLHVCFLVNSGSEANELALRLAQTHTGQRGAIVVDGAYHGHTTSLIDLSPYKCEGPGGRGLPPHVQKVSMPDTFRGRYPARPDAGRHYAADVDEAIVRLRGGGHRPAAFFCESLLSCGGQIVLPPGYLTRAFATVREAGGLAVADEVQTGFGRVGSHMWGFETQGVVPDIVTLGKPIGNGFPLGAVVTRPDIAASFANGMEYFNTYGGNPVACAAGLAVLDVLRDEHLQEHAQRVGTALLGRLETLKASFPLVGDVRGMGLFLGVELVADRRTLEPATDQATYVVNRLRDRGVLLSTDGPANNVLKIKPPLVFNEADVELLVDTLEAVLAEDPAQPGGRSG